ncbi:hypothetical protein [Bradyrhizobium sp. HKCCYLS20291]|uniref:hypothetical protein n=1 Tax=Bradyrhizobium sp. HKCCYLS20291 TaxID=3420766 RepID=UPI003EBFFA48
MAIPTARDHGLKAIEDTMANVATRLVTMRFTPGPKDRAGLRETLQTLVDLVMRYADDCE